MTTDYKSMNGNCVGVLAAAFGIALGRYVWPTLRGSDRDALVRTQTQVARLNHECITLRGRAEQLDAEHNAAASEAKEAGEDVARLTERVAGLTKKIEEQATQNNALETQRDSVASEAKTAKTEVVRLTERERALTQKIETQTRSAWPVIRS